MYRLMLWDMGVDWNKISDYELFLGQYKSGDKEANKLLFGDVDITNFKLYTHTRVEENEEGEPIEKQETVLYEPDRQIEISEDIYKLISEYLRAAFNIYPKVEKAKGRSAKELIIFEERQNLEARKKEGETNKSNLLPLVSGCINHPGFKYNLEELRNVNFV